MIIFIACVVGYLAVGWFVAPVFARWADNGDVQDPGDFGLIAGLFWPFAVVIGLVVAVWRWLGEAVLRRAMKR